MAELHTSDTSTDTSREVTKNKTYSILDGVRIGARAGSGELGDRFLEELSRTKATINAVEELEGIGVSTSEIRQQDTVKEAFNDFMDTLFAEMDELQDLVEDYVSEGNEEVYQELRDELYTKEISKNES